MTDSPGLAADAPPPESGGAEGRTAQPPGIVADSPERDDKVLALRERGRSFASIARALGFEGAGPANAAFNRALRRLPPADQESLRSHEMARLDALGERLRQRQDLDEPEMARRARTLERLRQKLIA
ncbi:MAG TPA: hypothetical protein VMF65_25880 [Acidimicrobiales bacterium]|nr:hypothetical protein [Acidimicrobiales bacterium]